MAIIIPGMRFKIRFSTVPVANPTVFRVPIRNSWGDEAGDAVRAYTRSRMREDGFYRRILPPVPVPNYEPNQAVIAPE